MKITKTCIIALLSSSTAYSMHDETLGWGTYKNNFREESRLVMPTSFMGHRYTTFRSSGEGRQLFGALGMTAPPGTAQACATAIITDCSSSLTSPKACETCFTLHTWDLKKKGCSMEEIAAVTALCANIPEA